MCVFLCRKNFSWSISFFVYTTHTTSLAHTHCLLYRIMSQVSALCSCLLLLLCPRHDVMWHDAMCLLVAWCSHVVCPSFAYGVCTCCWLIWCILCYDISMLYVTSSMYSSCAVLLMRCYAHAMLCWCYAMLCDALFLLCRVVSSPLRTRDVRLCVVVCC